MRRRLDCAVVGLNRDAWIAGLVGPHLNGRLMLRALDAGESLSERLSDSGLAHGRYDACVLHVDETTLSLWRTALATVGRLPTALVVYAVGLQASAIRDLLALGVADFIRPPFCPEELRARLDRVLRLQPLAHLAEGAAHYDTGNEGTGVTEAELCETILDRSGAELEAYAAALATRHATSRESFRAAKSEVVARFERAYIRAALGCHGGNITLAARMAQKHRRAFWALMRKHDIDPAPYRVDRDAAPPPDP